MLDFGIDGVSFAVVFRKKREGVSARFIKARKGELVVIFQDQILNVLKKSPRKILSLKAVKNAIKIHHLAQAKLTMQGGKVAEFNAFP